MNLLIRNVDAIAVAKIDKLAKTKKMSRQEYLKGQVEKLATFDVYEEERNRFEDTLQKVAEAMGQTMRMIQDQQEEIQKMKIIFMMVMDIDEEEIEQYMETFIFNEGDE